MPDRSEDDRSEAESWYESRRLIIAQLSRLDEGVRENSAAIQRGVDQMRETAVQLAKGTQKATVDLALRLALLEQRAKLWGAVIGLASGIAATVVTQLVLKGLRVGL